MFRQLYVVKGPQDLKTKIKIKVRVDMYIGIMIIRFGGSFCYFELPEVRFLLDFRNSNYRDL